MINRVLKDILSPRRPIAFTRDVRGLLTWEFLLEAAALGHKGALFVGIIAVLFLWQHPHLAGIDGDLRAAAVVLVQHDAKAARLDAHGGALLEVGESATALVAAVVVNPDLGVPSKGFTSIWEPYAVCLRQGL